MREDFPLLLSMRRVGDAGFLLTLTLQHLRKQPDGAGSIEGLGFMGSGEYSRSRWGEPNLIGTK